MPPPGLTFATSELVAGGILAGFRAQAWFLVILAWWVALGGIKRLFSEAGGATELETYDLLWNMSTEVGNVADSSKGGGMSDGIE